MQGGVDRRAADRAADGKAALGIGRDLLAGLLVPYSRVCEVRDICRERRANRATVRAMSKSHAIAMTRIITFGRDSARMFEGLSPAAQDAAFLELAEATADRLNTTVSGLVVHRDETTIHAHFELIGYTYDGRPLSAATKPGIMSSLQDLTAEIMGRHCPGIERGRRYGKRLAAGAEFRDILHRSVKRLHQDLPHELAEMEARLEAKREVAYGLAAGIPAMKAKIEDAPAVVDALTPQLHAAREIVAAAQARVVEMAALDTKAKADVEKAQNDAQKKAKVAKRVRTYGKRLADPNKN